MKFDIISIFPEFFSGPFSCGILRSAQEKKLIQINIINPRTFAKDGVVDDYMFGGGAGMVMKPEPLLKAIAKVHTTNSCIIQLTPTGRTLDQQLVKSFSLEEHIILICGRYKGIDARVRKLAPTYDISIGDYVLSGGEIAALALTESITRLLPNALGNQDSAHSDSYQTNLLEPPIYTRPHTYRKLEVPMILRSGNHRLIEQWRRKESLHRTLNTRPDLFAKNTFTKNDLALLLEVLND
jgi:tRNA (guanine37-N1)-methyltransferase